MSSRAIDQALIAMLGADTTLLSYVPDGVYWLNENPPGSKRFVEVSLPMNDDIWVFGHRAIEDRLYLVQAVMLSTAGTKANLMAAGARIDALLDGQRLGIGTPQAVDGYTFMEMSRERDLHESERLDPDKSIWWWRSGGYYRIQMALVT